MERGEIWWASLPVSEGSSPGYRRPVLVIQSDAFNVSNMQTVIVLAMTGNLGLANAPGNVLIRAKQSNLPRDSVINVSQVVTVDKSYITDYVGLVPGNLMHKVDEGMRLVLSL